MNPKTDHPTFRRLSQMVPNLAVSGMSFADLLPAPQLVAPGDREQVLVQARKIATNICLENLLATAGLEKVDVIPHAPGGNRMWPAGYVGSVTNKGTLVLSALGSKDSIEMLGIDLERKDKGKLLDPLFVAPEGVASSVAMELGTLLSFSAKEAVFKAQFPETGKMIEFRDISLSWRELNPNHFLAIGESPFQDFQIQVAIEEPWIISVALKNT